MPQSERWLGSAASQCSTLFLSTPSTRRATFTVTTRPVKSLFLPTPSTRRATRVMSLTWDVLAISTHALHEEGDISHMSSGYFHFDFYPRPPRGGRPRDPLDQGRHIGISTHALHEEGDQEIDAASFPAMRFLPTPSTRRATVHRAAAADGGGISTHALHEEGDFRYRRLQISQQNFYPRPHRKGGA